MRPATRGVLGIDPGRSGGGAAALVVDEAAPRAVLVVLWREIAPELFDVRWARAWPEPTDLVVDGGRIRGVPALGALIGNLSGEVPAQVSVCSEAPHIGKNAQSALSVARTGAALEAAAAVRLATGSVVKTRTIAPASWRKILGISAADREEAKAKSLSSVPLLVSGLPELLAAVGAADHVTDAAGVAAVGLRCAVWEGAPAGWAGRVAAAADTTRRPSRPGRKRGA